MSYPQWQYFPSNAEPPGWAHAIAELVKVHEGELSTVASKTGLSSDDVLAVLREGLEEMSFEVERGKRKDEKIYRAVLFGENGVPKVSYEVDAFHDGLGIAVEVEAGRGAQNGADYRNIVRTALILDARYLVLVMPIAYRFKSGDKEVATMAYDKTRDQVEAIYASQRLQLPFEGVLVLGY